MWGVIATDGSEQPTHVSYNSYSKQVYMGEFMNDKREGHHKYALADGRSMLASGRSIWTEDLAR